MIATPPNQLPRLAKGTRLLLWGAVVIGLALFVSVKAWNEISYARARDAWKRDIPRQEEFANKSYQRMQELFKNQGLLPLTRADIERKFNDGRPLPTTQHNGRELLLWTDPQGGRRYDFKFNEEGKWSGFGSHWGAHLSEPARTTPRLLEIIEPLRLQIAPSLRAGMWDWLRGWGPAAWIVLLLTFCIWRTYRAVVGELMLAVAIVTAGAWLISPNYRLVDVMSNDPMFWGTAMVVISAVILPVVLLYRAPHDLHQCHVCTYNLTGNLSGICPECGTAIPVKGSL